MGASRSASRQSFSRSPWKSWPRARVPLNMKASHNSPGAMRETLSAEISKAKEKRKSSERAKKNIDSKLSRRRTSSRRSFQRSQ